MITKGLFTSNTDQWATPKAYFEEINKEFDFNLDPCADETNHKCDLYYDRQANGLSKNWGGYRVYCNPPYGREISKWVEKSYLESKKDNTLVVMLLPARTDTRWFHDFIYHKAEIRFIKGRLKFNDGKQGAPFPSMLVIFDNRGK